MSHNQIFKRKRFKSCGRLPGKKRIFGEKGVGDEGADEEADEEAGGVWHLLSMTYEILTRTAQHSPKNCSIQGK